MNHKALLHGALTLATLGLAQAACAANFFDPNDLVLSVYGNGDLSGVYGDNQASPIVLESVTTSGSFVGRITLPQIVAPGSANSVISGEYGSSSEGSLQLSADGASLTIMGYGVNAAVFNAAEASGNPYGNASLAQTTSIQGGSFTAVARVVADIRADGTVDTSTALYNVFNTNNPRSVATVNGSSFYVAGQGVKGDATQGVFLAQDGASTAIAINTATDARTASISNGQLYVSVDTKQGSGSNGSSNIAVYGAGLPTIATAPTILAGISNGVTLTAAQANGVNNGLIGKTAFLSPENFFFANATTLYVADGGIPKQSVKNSPANLGDGGLQKWSLVSGTWVLDYTISNGLGLVANTASAGTTGLIGLTGKVVGGQVQLYATNATINDLDPTFLFGVTDTLGATTLASNEVFTKLVTAAADTNLRGVAFAPVALVPEPNAAALCLLGFGVLGIVFKRRAARGA